METTAGKFERKMVGLNRDQCAALFGVTRRTWTAWVSGSPVGSLATRALMRAIIDHSPAMRRQIERNIARGRARSASGETILVSIMKVLS